jgi:replication factor A1
MSERSLWYPACTECKKKVNPADNDAWFCERCNKTFPECNTTYNFTLRLGDYTSSVYAQVMGDSVGDLFWEMSARQLQEIAGDAGQTNYTG